MAPTTIALRVPVTGSVLLMTRTGISGEAFRNCPTTRATPISRPTTTGTMNSGSLNEPRDSQETPKNGSAVAPKASGMASQSKPARRAGGSLPSKVRAPTVRPIAASTVIEV